MPKELPFTATYIIRDGDICIREVGLGRFEVSRYDAASTTWQDLPILSAREVAKQIRPLPFLGTSNGWEFYRK